MDTDGRRSASNTALPMPWPELPITAENFRQPPRAYGILPFWFLNGELDPDEMRYQLGELRRAGMSGVILHGRYGLETPYIGPKYLDRVALATAEGEKLGLPVWIYDEMNWPSGTADGRVLRARPDLAERYLECISFNVRGPWFTYLTGADSRYLDFERSTPVAAFALRTDGDGAGRVIDLTPNLSFVNVIPWEAPPGNWRLMYILEKRADYYIDALDPEATAEFLRLGYEPYAAAVGEHMSEQMLGFYTDEPAMHYYLSGADNAVVPWTRDMFRRFHERNGYSLRPRLPDLFFDVDAGSARVRYDFYATLTQFYSDAYYRQIHEWCQAHRVLFTGHLLYEERLRALIRVEGNLFRHYEHMDVVGVDHLYPFIGNRDRPDEHVAMKVGSSGAHQLGSPRLLCESFGGIFMDATMQRMKWIADWEYVLGVNLLNPHGFHYTLEGPRKRDWPPSQFYQYPWWHYYEHFSAYISRLSHLLSGGRHVAKVAVLWPMTSMFATYTPQSHNALGDRTEHDFNALTDLLLRLHFDYDYLDEAILAGAEIEEGRIRVREESYELLVLPPVAYLKLSTVERLERFVAGGGRLLGMVFLPDRAFGPDGLVDVGPRINQLFGVDPAASQAGYRAASATALQTRAHGAGQAAFLQTYALARQLPMRLQKQIGTPGRPESPHFVVEASEDESRYWYAPPGAPRTEITAEVEAERAAMADALGEALRGLVEPDVIIDNPEIFYLHRIKDERDVYFIVNPTRRSQAAEVALAGAGQPLLWDPSTGEQRPILPAASARGRTRFHLELPPVGSAFVLRQPVGAYQITAADISLDDLTGEQVTGHGRAETGYVVVAPGPSNPSAAVGPQMRLEGHTPPESPSGPAPADSLDLDGEWEFTAEDANVLAIGRWLAAAEAPGIDAGAFAMPEGLAEERNPVSGTNPVSAGVEWLPMVPGAWAYQLPSEPGQPYPLAVWYRIPFRAQYLPTRLDLIVDGFAGASWDLYVNGQAVHKQPVRSALDGQMGAVDIAGLARPGDNLIALRLTLAGSTDGLLDLLKLMGDFSLAPDGEGGYAIVAPRRTMRPAPWTTQGYPFYSGRGVYRRRFNLPDHFAGRRVFLEPQMGDDVLEVIVNGRPAGVRLWEPYAIDIGAWLAPGENTVELRVANTLVNALEAVERPSGLAGAPRLASYRRFVFDLPGQRPRPS